MHFLNSFMNHSFGFICKKSSRFLSHLDLLICSTLQYMRDGLWVNLGKHVKSVYRVILLNAMSNHWGTVWFERLSALHCFALAPLSEMTDYMWLFFSSLFWTTNNWPIMFPKDTLPHYSVIKFSKSDSVSLWT